MIHIKPLHTVQIEELLHLYNACWHLDHLDNRPRFNVEHLQAFIQIHNISLYHSLGLTFNGELVGFSFLGLDKQLGWIGAIGIDKPFRGRGLSSILLNSQLTLCRKINLKSVTLEVSLHHFVSKMYYNCGFKFLRKLNNFEIAKIDILGAITNQPQQYDIVPKHEYFASKAKLDTFFPWKRREATINNYPNTVFLSSPDKKSGYVLNHKKKIIDIWASTRHEAHYVLAASFNGVDKITISHQIEDWLSIILLENEMKPYLVQYEMIAHLN